MNDKIYVYLQEEMADDENPSGAPMTSGESIANRGDAILKKLEENMNKFAGIATTVGAIKEQMGVLQTEVNQIKRGRQTLQLSDEEEEAPPSKRTHLDSSDSERNSDDDDDVDKFLQPESEASTTKDDFLSELDGFIIENEELGDDVSERIANISNKSIKIKADDSKIKEILERQKRPKNVELLQTPTVDDFLWRQLQPSTRQNDFLMQKNYGTLAQATVPIIKALEQVQASNDKILQGHISDAFKILTNGMHLNTARRRNRIKQELSPQYKHLGQLEAAGGKLFDKLQENLKTTEPTKIITTKQNKGKKPFLGQNRHHHHQFKRTWQNNSSSNNNYNNRHQYKRRQTYQQQKFQQKGQRKK